MISTILWMLWGHKRKATRSWQRSSEKPGARWYRRSFLSDDEEFIRWASRRKSPQGKECSRLGGEGRGWRVSTQLCCRRNWSSAETGTALPKLHPRKWSSGESSNQTSKQATRNSNSKYWNLQVSFLEDFFTHLISWHVSLFCHHTLSFFQEPSKATSVPWNTA